MQKNEKTYTVVLHEKKALRFTHWIQFILEIRYLFLKHGILLLMAGSLKETKVQMVIFGKIITT